MERYSALLVAVAAALWASDNYFRPALVSHHLRISQIVLVEDALISLCFVPLLLCAAADVRALRWRTWIAVAVIAVGPQALATVLFTQAFTYAFPVGAAPNPSVQVEIYLLYMLQPVFGLGFARLLLGERRRAHFWPLAIVAIAAVYVIVFPQDPLAPLSNLGRGQLAAALLVLGAVVLWALGTVLGRYALRDVPFVTTTGLRFVLALPVLLVIALVDGGGGALRGIGAGDLPSFLGIALIPGFLAMLLYYRGLSRTPASVATVAELAYPATLFIIFTLPPPVGQALPLHAAQVVGALLLITAVSGLNLLTTRHVVEQTRTRTPHASG